MSYPQGSMNPEDPRSPLYKDKAERLQEYLEDHGCEVTLEQCRKFLDDRLTIDEMIDKTI